MSSKYIYTSYIKKLSSTEEFDTEKFILEVQKRECIWNAKSKSYNLKCVRNRETKRRAWEEIAIIFTPNWDSLSVEDQQKKVEGLTKKWANIRKYYTDEVRKPVDSPPKKRRRRYHHLLTFLDEFVLKKRIQRINQFKNIPKEEINVETSSDSEFGDLFIVEDELKQSDSRNGPVTPILSDNKNDNPDPYLDVKHEADNNNLWENAANTPVIKTENSIMVKKNPEIMKLLKESRGPPPENNNLWYLTPSKPVENSVSVSLTADQTAEASKNFLLSLLPEVMTLDVKQNLQFRLGIMDLLHDIKMKVNPSMDPKIFPNINIA